MYYYNKMQSSSIETSSATQKVDYDNSKFYLGSVKWFNNKKGYGYVTVKEGPLAKEDIFTHHTSINIPEGKYRYLVAGEYVHIQVKDYDGDNHLYQASSIKAPCDDGLIMCEVRSLNQFKPKRMDQVESNEASLEA